jgi:hypothetical protein
LLKFHAIWGAKWAESIDGIQYRVLAGEWAEGIAGLTGEQIKTGIDRCRTTMAWPPSIAEFRSACEGGSTPEQRAYAERAERDKAGLLERSTWGDRKAVGLRHLAALHDQLSGKDPTAASVTRSPRNVSNTTWTPAMEARFVASCRHLAIEVPATNPTPQEAAA